MNRNRNYARKILGLGLCGLGSPSLLTLLFGLSCHGGGPDWTTLLLAPLAVVGLPFVPVMVLGLRLMEESKPGVKPKGPRRNGES